MKNNHQPELNIPQTTGTTKRTFPLWVLLLCLITLAVAFYCLIAVENDGYRNLFILPLTMAVCLLVTSRILAATIERVPFFIFYFITYLRFVVIPFLMIQSGFYNSRYYPAPTDSGANAAVWLMCYELVAYTAMLCVFKKKLLKLADRTMAQPFGNTHNGILFISAVALILFVAASCVMKGLTLRVSVLMFYLPASKANFVFGENMMVAATAILYMLCFKVWQKNRKTPVTNILFGLVSGLWVCVCFGDVRLSYIIKAAVVISLLLDHMKKKLAKKYVFLIAALGVVSVVAITLLDDTASHGLFFFTGTESEKHTYAHVLQTYFSGPYNVAKSVDLSKRFHGDGFSQFITDLLYNAYPWSELLPSTAISTKTLFNNYLYGSTVSGTQIIPLLGQGMIYFGPVFSVVPPLICLFLMIQAELSAYKNYRHACFSAAFSAEYTSIYLSFFQMYNLIIIFGYLLAAFLVLGVVSFIQDHFKNGRLTIIKA